MRETSFRDFIVLLAKNAEVEISATKPSLSSKSIHLPSEFKVVSPGSVTLASTDALKRIFEAWGTEFEKKHSLARADNIRYCSLFKSVNIKAKTRPYEARDDPLSSEPMQNPLSFYSWLPSPGKKVEVFDNDIQLLERFSRVSLRTLNFVEVSIQAWHKLRMDRSTVDVIMKRMTYAVKALMQLQTCATNSIIQLRRDHFLLKVKGVSHEHKQLLRHAPILGQKKLFPDELLSKINKANKDSVQEKALLRVVSGGFTKKQDQSKPQKQGTPKSTTKSAEKQSNWLVDCSDSDSVSTSSCSNHVLESVAVTNIVSSSPRVVSQAMPTNLIKYDWTEERAAITVMNSTPVGGRLKLKWQNWKQFGASKKIVRWLRKGYMLPFNPGQETVAKAKFSRKSDPDLVAHYQKGSEKAIVLDMMIDTLLKKNVIVRMDTEEKGFFNLVFLRRKKAADSETRMEKRWRLILDVSKLNVFLRVKHFTMETAEKIRKEVTPNTWATSVDLTDAYHHLPIHPHFQNFLAFEVAGVNYKYVACPFGLSPIPQVFTEVMTSIKTHMRENTDSLVFQYIDDWLLIAKTPQLVLKDTIKFVQLCIELGVIVNPDKSQLEPTQTLDHLGYSWDFKLAQISVPAKKVVEISDLCDSMLDSNHVRVANIESLQGKFISVEKAVPYGRIHYRNFQKEVVRHVRKGRNHRKLLLSANAKEDLKWWSKSSHVNSPCPCHRPSPETIVTTDASLTGWGIVLGSQNWRGTWNGHEKRKHINELELLTVLKALRLVILLVKGDHVQFLIDNRTACCYINKQGGTKSVRMNTIARRVWLLAESHKLHVSAVFIKGQNNVIADMLSRRDQVLKAEWMLAPETFKWVVNHSPWDEPTVDLFANSMTHQLKKYMSPCPDGQAMAIDALISPWPVKETLYAFPPTTIMVRVLEKIQLEKPQKLLLLAPFWPTTTWFSSLKNMSRSWTRIPLSVLKLLQPHTGYAHQNPDSICLVLWLIQFPDSQL